MPDCSSGNYVLIVDDDPDVCKILSLSFEHFGCPTRVAMRGHEALNAIKQKTPDLIMLDLMLPDVSGFEILTFLQDDPHTKDIPVIVLTALGDPVELAKLNGVMSVLRKSDFSLSKLQEMVTDLFEGY
jgi:CheY-like chemotaxis protein